MLAAIAMCLCAVSQARQQQLAQKLIRLHVVANSDTAEDQRLKLLVRDAVLRATADVLEEETDPEAALQNGLPTIEQAANETLSRLGSGDMAKVSLRRELFPTRDYETFRLPAGVYRTLRVTIGTGEGHNWWCVVFPALCLPANGEDFEAVCGAPGCTGGEISFLPGKPARLKWSSKRWNCSENSKKSSGTRKRPFFSPSNLI